MKRKLVQISLFFLLMCLCEAYSNEKKNKNGARIAKSNRLLSEIEENEVGIEVYKDQPIYKEQPVYDDQSLCEGQPNNEALVVRDKTGKPVDKNNLKNNIKIVFTDLNGTLLNSHHKASKLNIESLAKAYNKGIKIVFATGRPLYSVNYIIGKDVKQNNLSLMPGTYLNGCVTYGPNGERIIDNYIDEKLVMDIYNFSKENNLLRRIVWYSSEKAYAFEINEYIYECMAIEPIMPDIIDEETLKKTKIYQILIKLDKENLSSVLKIYQDKFSDRISVVNPLKTFVELFHHNTNKFEGVKALCKHFDISLNDALAIGDGENDIEMLKGVGTSIAVQNAPSKIKECAKYVAPSNNDDAVHHAIRTFCDI
ncbi:haloacid dehalogenase-like hydrolase, putative [Plasmodium chabaudi chabaudi]|uniref:Haloacid dehalogenase-like hydrolase, putative n=1 Tax=Plasmodium chabaudi chabaudi TaxID=31271 RepID=A0A077TIB4_PLACU|nr:haloacid dehalogenase-like hydrolase, putative [Plasmodium chabaudi chabaudi]SCL92688.1 haloacid dehalogenase-like hydrolase, putative [Plasmodium chabaudi chabaudi]VTZ66327.1 haloacid dehalogenase-like hydrolase, putative [Plasmodium chabaudi chabaudi]|eukprot:XP_016653042.1 haloacid dehalogenase-like hydrolase, putative [Plasmodium chabaudi chabaudi]